MSSDSANRPLMLITGVARNGERLATLERQIENAKGYVCDVTDTAHLD